jgi:hypothetical protein
MQDIPEFALVAVLRYLLSRCPRPVLARHGAPFPMPDTGAGAAAAAAPAARGEGGKKRSAQGNAQAVVEVASAAAGAAAGGAESEEERSSRALESLLHLVVAAPHNPVFMLAALRELSLGEAAGVLAYLLQLLARLASASAVPANKPAVRPVGSPVVASSRLSRRCPSMAQGLDWAALVVDSHFAAMAVAPRAETRAITALVLQLRTFAVEQAAVCDRMQSIKGHLAHLTRHEALPVVPIPDYAVETLALF